MVVNAQHIKAVPGRKTDVKDSEWIADLLRNGLLKGKCRCCDDEVAKFVLFSKPKLAKLS